MTPVRFFPLFSAAILTAWVPSAIVSAAPMAAIVNGEGVPQDKILSQLKEVEGKAKEEGKTFTKDEISQGFGWLRETAINVLICLEAAKKEGLDQSQEYKNIIKDLTNRVTMKLYIAKIEKEIAKKISTEMVSEKAAEIAKDAKNIVLQKVVVKTQAMADQIKTAMKSGLSFKDAATKALQQQAKKDKTPYRAEKLDVDPILDIALSPEQRKMFDAMKKNELNVLPQKEGFLILVLMDRKSVSANTEEVQSLAQKKLEDEMRKKFFQDLKSKAKIERFDIEGNLTKESEADSVPIL